MSYAAMDWAANQPVKSSSQMLVLVFMGKHASKDDNLAWPSVAELAEETRLDRKTVLATLEALQAAGLLVDTGTKKGRTGQVKVFRLPIETVPETASLESDLSDPEIGPPNPNGTEIPGKRSQNSHATVPNFPSNGPKNGIRKKSGIDQEEVRKKKEAHAPGFQPESDFEIPQWVPQDAWTAYLDMRRGKKKVPTRLACELVVKELTKIRTAGHSVGDALDRSTRNGWTDVYGQPPKAQAKQGKPSKAEYNAMVMNSLTGRSDSGASNDFIDGGIRELKPYALGR